MQKNSRKGINGDAKAHAVLCNLDMFSFPNHDFCKVSSMVGHMSQESRQAVSRDVKHLDGGNKQHFKSRLLHLPLKRCVRAIRSLQKGPVPFESVSFH